MTILDFPTGGRARAAWPPRRSAHPTAVARRASHDHDHDHDHELGEPPSGAWLDAYEQLAACCAELVATPRLRVYDADWEDLVEWIRGRLAVLDALRAPGAS